MLQQACVRRSFQPSIEYELVDSAQLEPIFKRGGGDWPAYYKRFPGSQGVLTFSRVGFRADGTSSCIGKDFSTNIARNMVR